MTEKQRKRVLAEIEARNTEIVAKEAGVSEITLLRVLLGLTSVHRPSITQVEQYAAGLK